MKKISNLILISNFLMDYNKFKVTEFDLSSMVINPAIVMIARRGSGKSWVARDIIHTLRHLPAGIVIAPTDKMNPFYKKFFPDLYIHYDIGETLLKKILARQTIMVEKEIGKKKAGLKIDPRAILIMDDCLARAKNWKKDENIAEIMMNGRHFQLTYILTMQTPLGITPDLRLNFDYVFLLKEDSAINKKKLWDNYASMFQTLNAFDQVFKNCTKDNCCMVIDNRKATDTIQEKVFWFKAKERKFTFGSKEFVRLHKKYFDETYKSRKTKEMINNNNLGMKKRNEVNIQIEKVGMRDE